MTADEGKAKIQDQYGREKNLADLIYFAFEEEILQCKPDTIQKVRFKTAIEFTLQFIQAELDSLNATKEQV